MSYKPVHGQKAHDQWGIFGYTQQGVPPAYVIPFQVQKAWPRYGIQDSAFYGLGGIAGLGCGPECSCGPCQAATAAALQGLGGCGCAATRPVVGGSTAGEFQGLGDATSQALAGGVLSGLLLAGLLAGVVYVVAKPM